MIVKILYLILNKVHVVKSKTIIDCVNYFINQKFKTMKLESLKLGKFKDNTLKREQMITLNGGGTVSSGGNTKGPHGPGGQNAIYDYGYDSYRNGTLTFHNRTNVRYFDEEPALPYAEV